MHKIYDPDHYRIVFFSSAPIGVPFLQRLNNDKRFDIVGVVTMPDAPSGRGMQMQENIIKQEARKLLSSFAKGEVSAKADGGFFSTPIKLNPSKSDEGRAFADRLVDKQPDFLVVIAYGKIIPQTILDIPKIAPINVHGSLLPRYRWASPIQSCLLNDEKETGITIIKMDAGMDTGHMIDKIGFKIPFDRTSKDIITRMQHIGPKFLNDTLRKYGKNMRGEVEQDNVKATYCSKIEKESWLINPRKDSLHSIYSKYRAFAQRPKIYFHMPSWRSSFISKESLSRSSTGRDHESGGGFRIIVENLKLYEGIYLQTQDKPLINEKNELHEAVENIILKPEGKKPMTWQEFTNGYMREMGELRA